MENAKSCASGDRGLHRFALLTAAAAFALIFVGGLVNSTGSALAVPDWPLAFGKVVPTLAGGVRFEFGHRVTAAAVALLTLVLVAWTLRREPRRWMRNTAPFALTLIIIQAILGGLTVLLLLPVPIAVAHSAAGQAFFCLMVALSVFTDAWFIGAKRRAEPPARVPLTILCMVTTAAIYLQVVEGAVTRHLGAGLAIPDFPAAFGGLVPPVWNGVITVDFAHRIGALIVTGLVLWMVARVIAGHRGEPRLRRPADSLILLLLVQVLLGAFTVWTRRTVLLTTAHVAAGAAVLAASLTLTIRAWRIYGVPRLFSAMAGGRSASGPANLVGGATA